MSNERWRSFAERYVIARAQHFKEGQEQEDGWKALLDAKTLYKKIAGMYDDRDEEKETYGSLGGPGVQAYIGGATGPAAPWKRNSFP